MDRLRGILIKVFFHHSLDPEGFYLHHIHSFYLQKGLDILKHNLDTYFFLINSEARSFAIPKCDLRA